MFRRFAFLALLLAVALGTACAGKAAVAPQPVADYAFPPADDPSWDPPLNRWEMHYVNRMAKFRAENATLDPAKRHVVFAGDSITEGFPLQDYLADLPVLNRGIGSDGVASWPDRLRTRGLENRLATSVFDCNPAVVFILMGINDMPHDNVPMDYWVERYEGIVDKIQKGAPDAVIVIETLLPTGEKYANHAKVNPRVLEYNDRLRDIAKRKGTRLLDLHALYVDDKGLLQADTTGDGLHLAKEAYRRWAEAARPIAEEALAAK